MQCHWIYNCGGFIGTSLLCATFTMFKKDVQTPTSSTGGELGHRNLMEKQETNPSLLKPCPTLETLPSTITTELLLAGDFSISSASCQQIPNIPGAILLGFFWSCCSLHSLTLILSRGTISCICRHTDFMVS